LISSALLHFYGQQGWKTAGMKPVAAGCVEDNGRLLSEDVTMLLEAGNTQAAFQLHSPYAFAPPIAPHIAAEAANETIRQRTIHDAYRELSALADVVIVEGVGGFRVPLGEQFDTADLAQMLNLPVILVVGMRLGCINHALLTIESIQARGLELAGWVANRIDPEMSAFEENLQALDQRIGATCLGVLPHLPQADFRQAAEYLQLTI
jgi:dethiobiotin synthetase